MHARVALAAWKLDYNTVRPHSAIGNLPPAIYTTLGDPAKQQDGSLRLPRGYAPPPRCTSSLDEHWGSGQARQPGY
jgi:putative transposase